MFETKNTIRPKKEPLMMKYKRWCIFGHFRDVTYMKYNERRKEWEYCCKSHFGVEKGFEYIFKVDNTEQDANKLFQ